MGAGLADARIVDDRGPQDRQPRSFGGKPDSPGLCPLAAQATGQGSLSAGGVEDADAGMIGQGVIRPRAEQVAFAGGAGRGGFQRPGQGGIGGLVPADQQGRALRQTAASGPVRPTGVPGAALMAKSQARPPSWMKISVSSQPAAGSIWRTV